MSACKGVRHIWNNYVLLFDYCIRVPASGMTWHDSPPTRVLLSCLVFCLVASSGAFVEDGGKGHFLSKYIVYGTIGRG